MATTQPQLTNPLTPADLAALNRELYMLNQMLPWLDKAQATNHDVTDLRLRRDDLAQTIQTFKAQYFPGSK